MSTKIILVRHAECVGNIEKRLAGRTDFELTEEGKKQACELAKKLKYKKIDTIISSPLKRAIETAKEIAKETNNLNIEINNELIEIDYGVCDGMQWEDIDRKYPKVRKEWKEIHNYPINIPKQEEYKCVQERMINALKSISIKNEGHIICIVSHGIAIQSLMCYIYKKDINQAYEIPQLKNAHFIEFEM